MQEVIAWLIVAGIVFIAWRMYRGLRKAYRQAASARSEAFSNAVSKAVASGVAHAISASIADSTAAATGGSVNVHIGDNIARLLAEHYDDTVRPDANESHDTLVGRSSLGSLHDTARRGELASRRVIRRSDIDSPNRRSVRVPTTGGSK